jgi:uncharacterized damage-inducible protein DinB
MSLDGHRVRRICDAYLDQYLGKIRFCVNRLDEDQVWARTDPSLNSVGNLVLHLCGNLSQWVLSGLGGEGDTRRRPLEFAADRTATRSELVARLDAVVRRCRAVVRALDDDALATPRRIQDRRIDALGALVHAVEHMSYHTGQIVFAAKQALGRESGIDFYPHLNAASTTRPTGSRRPPRAARARSFKGGKAASGRRRGRR